MAHRWAVVVATKVGCEEIHGGWFDTKDAAQAHLRSVVDPLGILITRLMSLHFGVCGCSEPAVFNDAEMECQGPGSVDCGCDCHELEAMVPDLRRDMP